MKYSKQKEIIRNIVIGNRMHLTSDEVYAMAKEQLPSIGIATVYRNLRKLAQNGEVQQLSLPNDVDRFDGNVAEHYHLICDDCGKIIDADLGLLNDIDDLILEKTGFYAKSHQLTMGGYCSECAKKVNS